MPAVAKLDKDAKYALLYQLLKIFLTQRLDAYLDYHATNSDMLKSCGLVHEECISKMRLMSLLDLGSDESGQIPYELIRDTQRINDDEVELWVVKAITAKLIDCKMDQMNQVVIVSHPTDRVFGLHQWQTLRTKLATWRHSRTAAAADSWDWEINSEINDMTTTSTYHCNSSSSAACIRDCIAPEEEFLMDHSFRRMLADGSSDVVQPLVVKPDVTCSKNSNGRYQCPHLGDQKFGNITCNIYNRDNLNSQ